MPFVTEYTDNRVEHDERAIMRLRAAHPTLVGEHGGYEGVNRFVDRFVDAYLTYVKKQLYPKLRSEHEDAKPSVRGARFPYSVTLSCVCSETAWGDPCVRDVRELVSLHFSAEVSSADREYTSLSLRSFVFDADSGFLLSLHDVAGRRLASKRHGWNFYLSKGSLRLYKTDRHGKVRKREKYPT